MSTVACIGAGTVGRAWAVVFARAHLFDQFQRFSGNLFGFCHLATH